MEKNSAVFPNTCPPKPWRRRIGKLVAAVTVLLLAVTAPAQTLLLSEGFNTNTLPSGWTSSVVQVGVGTGIDPALSFVTNSTYSYAIPHEGSNFVKFNSWDCRTNAQIRLVSPVISAANQTNLCVQFAWYQDARTDKDAEGITLQWSTNNWASWSNASPFTMRRGTPTSWVERAFTLPVQAISTNLKIGFLFLSQYGNNCYLDDVRVQAISPISSYPSSEDFESGFGIWAAGPGSDFPWTRNSGLTPSGAYAGQTTGVSAAQSESFYLYTEASDPNFPSKAATLEAPFTFAYLVEPRWEFYYHMCGTHIGSLYAEISTNNGLAWTVLWSKTGQQHSNETDPWSLASIDLSSYAGKSNIRLRFRGVTGSGGLGDMAIDSIILTGPCSELASAVCVSNSAPAVGDHVTAGVAYTKTWVMSNNSSSAWSSNALYSFAFGRGDNPSTSSVVHFAAGETVNPGGTRSFSVSFTAPTNAGTCAGFWSLRRNGTNIGERVWLNVEVDMPEIAITNQQTSVASGTASTGLGGTKHSTVVGIMRWTNSLTGSNGTFAAASPWSISGIVLSSGDNLITVSGTNAAGIRGEASIIITRLAAPVVTITTPDATVSSGTTLLAVTGTANSAVSGFLRWTNSLGGYGSIPAATLWTIPDVPLAYGTNWITVTGTNAVGETSSDTNQIIRPAAVAGGALLDEPFDDAPTTPSGWTFNGITSNYVTSANSGRDAPSVRLDNTGDWLLTPTFSGPSNLTFWIKGQGTDANSSLLVESYSGGSWSTVDTILPLPTSGTTKSYLLSNSVTRLRFTYTKSAGNLAFDDVIVTGPGQDPDADDDGDGMSNYEESIAGTDPGDEDSFFAATGQRAAGGGNLIQWGSVAGRLYSISWTPSLTNSFGSLVTGLAATPSLNSYTDTVHTAVSSIFYRIGVSLAP